LNERPDTVGAFKVRAADALVPLADAEILAVVSTPTAAVVTVKVAVLDPAATVTEVATVAAAWSEVKLTTKPPAGALPVRVTVPVDGLPPTRLVGFNETD